jgi:hypothetical protein
MQANVKLTIRIPANLHERLKGRAQHTKQSLNTTIVDTLRTGLAEENIYQGDNEARAWRAIRETGLWQPLGSEWTADIDSAPEITHKELMEMMRGVAPLSETIIEERGEHQ